MKNRTKVLFAATLSTFLVAGQTALAGGGERDEYSIGVVWETGTSDSMVKNRVNYSIPQMTEEEHSALQKELFPEYEGN